MEEYSTRQTLLGKIRDRHDDASWEDFVFYYRRYIYVVVRGMNVSHHDAEEVVQTVLLKVWNKLPDFQYDSGRGRFRSWLCSVALNAVRDFLRSRKRRDNKLEKLRQEDVASLDSISVPEIEAIAEQEWDSYIANMAWNQMEKEFSEKVRECFLLMGDEVPVPQIAANLGISESSVYVYKKRVQDRFFAEINRLERELS